MALNNAINSPMLGGISTLTANAVLLGNAASTITAAAAFSADGQLLIGNGVNAPAVATLTAGNGITITNGAGTISIAATGDSSFSLVAGTSQTMVAGTSYIATNAALTTFTLPAVAAAGTVLRIGSSGVNAGGWTLAQAAGQSVRVGNVASTAGVGGSVSSTSASGGDALEFVCTVANTTWVAVSALGSLTVV